MSGDRKILEISEIRLAILESLPPKLKISVKGRVGSTGWENPRLIPYRYITEPQDGVWEFDFIAQDPSSETGIITVPTLMDIETLYIWENYPEDSVKGVRVYASTNSISVMTNGDDTLNVLGGSNSVMGGGNSVMIATIIKVL
ncbi:MAG: hypothetical protein ACFE0I_17090 [Elainellaceae cyanobacterium]